MQLLLLLRKIGAHCIALVRGCVAMVSVILFGGGIHSGGIEPISFTVSASKVEIVFQRLSFQIRIIALYFLRKLLIDSISLCRMESLIYL
jgi:hypothetical protein